MKHLQPKTFADKLLMLRLKAGLTQKQLAEKLSLAQGRVSDYENNRGRPSHKTLTKLILLGKRNHVEFTADDILTAGDKRKCRPHRYISE